jgi:hypothetical protein
MFLEQVDRAIYEYLRRKVVVLGFLPDITNYETEEEYNAARATRSASLNNNGLKMVDVYGTGSWENRGEKTDSKIIVERRDISSGKTGFSGVSEYVPNVSELTNEIENYSKVKMPDKTANIEYEVRYVTTTVKMERILLDIIDSVFGKGTKVIYGVDEDGSFIKESFPLVYNGGVDVSNREFIEGFARFTAEEVYLENRFDQEGQVVPVLIQVNAQLKTVSIKSQPDTVVIIKDE